MSKENKTEDTILVAESQGPVIRRSWEPFEFSILFDVASKAWLTREIKLTRPYEGTIGEHNRKYLHRMLDVHIDDLLNNTRTRDVNPYE